MFIRLTPLGRYAPKAVLTSRKHDIVWVQFVFIILGPIATDQNKEGRASSSRASMPRGVSYRPLHGSPDVRPVEYTRTKSGRWNRK